MTTAVHIQRRRCIDQRLTSRFTRKGDRLVIKTYLIAETNHYYSWGMLQAASHTTALNLVSSNIRNQFNASFEYGWNKNLEAEFTYERYLHDYLRVFGGVNIENEIADSFNEFSTTAVRGTVSHSLSIRTRCQDRQRVKTQDSARTKYHVVSKVFCVLLL